MQTVTAVQFVWIHAYVAYNVLPTTTPIISLSILALAVIMIVLYGLTQPPASQAQQPHLLSTVECHSVPLDTSTALRAWPARTATPTCLAA